MIFVTVGGQMAFDRLIGLVDAWAGRTGRKDLFAQIGPTEALPRHMAYSHFLEPIEFQRRLREADLVIAHAGMGTILSALQHGKPILVLPRRGHLRETRNDHQVATALRLRESGQLGVALDDAELVERLEHLDRLPVPRAIERTASPELLDAIQGFVQ